MLLGDALALRAGPRCSCVEQKLFPRISILVKATLGPCDKTPPLSCLNTDKTMNTVIIALMAKPPSILGSMYACGCFANYGSSFSLVFLPSVCDFLRYPMIELPILPDSFQFRTIFFTTLQSYLTTPKSCKSFLTSFH